MTLAQLAGQLMAMSEAGLGDLPVRVLVDENLHHSGVTEAVVLDDWLVLLYEEGPRP